MPYDHLSTLKLGLPHFGASGAIYSAEADKRRFLYLDYNLKSYLGIVGIGLIDGWGINDEGGLNITIEYGTAIINGFFSESPFSVKTRANVLPSDYVITEDYYIEHAAETAEQYYDPDLYDAPVITTDSDIHYDKVLFSPLISLTDNSDNYLYIYRNINILSSTPYYEPNNTVPIPESSGTVNPLYTSVYFGVTSSKSYANSSNRIMIGKIVTREGMIDEIDTTMTISVKNLSGTILSYGQNLVDTHRHGGANKYDPPKVQLRTDIRKCSLKTSSNSSATYQVLASEDTSIVSGHKHSYYIDSVGNGITVNMIGGTNYHYHNIVNYNVGTSIPVDGEIISHTHTITFSFSKKDQWLDTSDYQIYINDIPYDGLNANVYPDSKIISFTDDITVTKRKYKIDKTFSDGSKFVFAGEFNSCYRFCLESNKQYYVENSETISSGEKQNLFSPNYENSYTPLQNQCLVAETQLVESGDTFTFVGEEVAVEPITVELVEPGFTDSVYIEITSNSEVSGQLKAKNILYIPADKILTGTIDIVRIPIISHTGRYLEECHFESSRASSYDGYVYYLDGMIPFGNSKIIYSTYMDDSDNILISTSDGLYRYPSSGAYIFIINGVSIITDYGDLTTQLKIAIDKYSSTSGLKIKFIDSIYDPQIIEAEKVLLSYDTFYQINGSYSYINSKAVQDEINIYFVNGYKIKSFGYETIRREDEILEGEEIVSIIGTESVSSDSISYDSSGTQSTTSNSQDLKILKVKNDFNKSTVKQIFVEKDVLDTYGGVNEKFLAISNDYIAQSTNLDSKWNIIYQSSSMGYIKNIVKNYRGYYIANTSTGIYICTNASSSEYRMISLPEYNAEISSCEFGYNDDIIISYNNKVYLTQDYGKNWTLLFNNDSNIKKIFFDRKHDITSTVANHYHLIDTDSSGNGFTSTMYNDVDEIILTDHNHTILNGEIVEVDNHVHEPIRIYYVLDELQRIFISTTWNIYSTIPYTYGEIGLVFSIFDKIFVNTKQSVIYAEDGLSWIVENYFDDPIYSYNWNDVNSIVYLGMYNKLVSYDGNNFEEILLLDGYGKPSVYVDDNRQLFNFIVNNYKRKIDFDSRNLSDSTVDINYIFDKCYTDNLGWSDASLYDLYINDLLIKSTKSNVIISEDLKVNVNNKLGLIDFSASTKLLNSIEYGDLFIDVINSDGFPSSGFILISWVGEISTQYAYYKYSSILNNRLYLTSPSLNNIRVKNLSIDTVGNNVSTDIDVSVMLLNNASEDDSILITIYEGKLKNVGENTHDEIEDYLSYQNIGSPKKFSDVYLSNLMHMTTAMKYVISNIGDYYKNYFVSLFDYNDIPGDSNNINRYIDIASSDLYSQLVYNSEFTNRNGTIIYEAIYGFGNYNDDIFVASNVGLFVSKTDESFRANWFRINIDDSILCYDISQIDSDRFIVCTEKGLYICSNDFTTISMFNDKLIGGIPYNCSLRWDKLGIYSKDTYWWQKWLGSVHENSTLVNSIIISGDNFCKVSDDYGKIWKKSYIYDVNNNLYNRFSINSPNLLFNGSLISSVQDINKIKSSVVYSSGNGEIFKSIYDFNGYTGQVTSYSITKNNNIVLAINFDLIPPSSSLNGLILYCNNNIFKIITNSESNVVIYSSEILDSLTVSNNIVIPSLKINSIANFINDEIILSTSNGLYTDNGVFLASKSYQSGIVKDLGIKATVVSINISGVIQSSIVTNLDNIIISVKLDRIVKKNKLTGYRLNSIGFTEASVISNSESKMDGLTTLKIACDWKSIPIGLKFTLLTDDNRIYVVFDKIIKPGDLSGGRLLIEQFIYGNAKKLSEIAMFEIISNGYDYIDIKKNDSYNINNIVFADSVIYCSNNQNQIPVYSSFVNLLKSGLLKNNYITLNNVTDDIKSVDIPILWNDEITLYLPFSIKINNIEYCIYNLILNGSYFEIKNPYFEQLNSFNVGTTSKNNDHTHTCNLYGKYILGTVSSFGENKQRYLDININTLPELNLSPFLGNPSLLFDQDILFYDSNNYSRVYKSKIISSSSTIIRVVNDTDIFNIDNNDDRKVSSGFSFIIDASLYGTTNSTEYSKDFVISQHSLTQDTFIKGQTFYINDTSSLNIGDSISIRDREGLLFESSIDNILSSTSFSVIDESPFDYLVNKDSYCQIKYSNLNIGDFVFISDALINTDILTIADTSDLNIGDSITIKDSRGIIQNNYINDIVDSQNIKLDDVLSSDFTVLNGSFFSCYRQNYLEDHSHTISNGEFTRYANSDWNAFGYEYYHSHVIAPLIKDATSVKMIDNKAFVSGNSNIIYSSNNFGIIWSKEFDVNNLKNGNIMNKYINKIFSDNDNIQFSTDLGFLINYSSKSINGIIPLDDPVNN